MPLVSNARHYYSIRNNVYMKLVRLLLGPNNIYVYIKRLYRKNLTHNKFAKKADPVTLDEPARMAHCNIAFHTKQAKVNLLVLADPAFATCFQYIDLRQIMDRKYNGIVVYIVELTHQLFVCLLDDCRCYFRYYRCCLHYCYHNYYCPCHYY